MLIEQQKIANSFLDELKSFKDIVINAVSRINQNEDISEEYQKEWKERIIESTNKDIENLERTISEENWNEVKGIAGKYLSIGKKLDSFGYGWTKLEKEIDISSDKLFKYAKDIEILQ